MKKIFTTKLTNAVEPAAHMSVWRKGCAGKGEPITTKNITKKEND